MRTANDIKSSLITVSWLEDGGVGGGGSEREGGKQ